MFKNIKITKSKDTPSVISFWVDEGTHCCGENRTDWTHLGVMNYKDLLQRLIELNEKDSGTVYLN